jgi:hypothetical protein
MRIHIAAALALLALAGCDRGHETGQAGAMDTTGSTTEIHDTTLISHDTTVSVDTTVAVDTATKTGQAGRSPATRDTTR